MLRGGSWRDAAPGIFRSAYRGGDYPNARNFCLGFRVVRTFGTDASSTPTGTVAPVATYAAAPGASQPTVQPSQTPRGADGERIIAYKGSPTCLAITPVRVRSFGFGFAVGNRDGTIALFDLQQDGNVRPQASVRGEAQAIHAIAFSPDANWYAAAHDHTISIWETSGGQQAMRRLRGDEKTVTAVQFSSDGSQLLSASEDGTLRLWDVLNETEIRKSKVPPIRSCVYSADWSPDRRLVLYGVRVLGADSMALWNLNDELEEAVFDTGKQITDAVGFSRSGQEAYGLCKGSVSVYDLQSRERKRQFGTGIRIAAFLGRTNRVLSADESGLLTLWDAHSGTMIRYFHGHTARLLALAASDARALAISASGDGTLRVWDLPPSPPPENQLRLFAAGGPVSTVAFQSDGSTVLTASSTEMASWALTGDGGKRVFESVADVRAAAFSVDGRYILFSRYGSVGKEGIVGLRESNGATARDERQFKAHQGQATDAVMSFDGTHVVTGGVDGAVCVWNVRDGQPIGNLDVGTRVNSVAISRTGEEILVGANDKPVRLWHWNSIKKVDLLEGHAGAVHRVAFAGDGKRAVSASADGTVRVWDVAGRKPLAKLEGHAGPVEAAAISDHGMTVLSGGDDSTVRLWDVTRAKEITRFEGHIGRVRSVALSPDTTRALSGGDDGTARLWRLPIVDQ